MIPTKDTMNLNINRNTLLNGQQTEVSNNELNLFKTGNLDYKKDCNNSRFSGKVPLLNLTSGRVYSFPPGHSVCESEHNTRAISAENQIYPSLMKSYIEENKDNFNRNNLNQVSSLVKLYEKKSKNLSGNSDILGCTPKNLNFKESFGEVASFLARKVTKYLQLISTLKRTIFVLSTLQSIIFSFSPKTMPYQKNRINFILRQNKNMLQIYHIIQIKKIMI